MLRKVLVNRFTITFGGIAVAVVLWNLYIVQNDDGMLRGRVVGPDGAPVAAALVRLSKQTIVSLDPIDTTTTDDRGAFQFVRHDQHSVVLTAAKGVRNAAQAHVPRPPPACPSRPPSADLREFRGLRCRISVRKAFYLTGSDRPGIVRPL